jgi:hypothetical protein
MFLQVLLELVNLWNLLEQPTCGYQWTTDAQTPAHAELCAARIVIRTRRHVNTLLPFSEIHWLPVRARINFKILLLFFKCVKNYAPKYLTELLHA